MDEAEYSSFLQEFENNVRFVEEANIADYLGDTEFEKIDEISRLQYEWKGEKVRFLTDEESEELKIHKGTLTSKERSIIEEHVVYTDKILSKITFGKKYNMVRFFAGAHHEFINGTGYPNHLQEKDIPLEVRILTIMDVFDSLSSSDRPYRKQSSLADTFDILRAMAGEGKLDSSLVELARKCFLKEE